MGIPGLEAMPDLRIAIALLILSLVIYHLLSRPKIRRNGEALRQPPDTLPFAGNGIRFLQDRHKLFSWFAKCERIFGFETFQISVPTLPPGVVINDPKNVEFVFKNEAIFGKGEFFKSRSWDLFGHGIINADGDLWRVQRKAGLQFLNTANLKALTDIALPRALHTSVKHLYRLGANEPVDLESIFNKITTTVMGRMAYDMDIKSTGAFSRAFEYASGATGQRFQNPLWQVTELFTGKRLRQSLAEVKSFGQEIVANAVKAREMKEPQDDELATISGSLIYALLDSIPDHQIVADAALNYLSAGRDTTAQGLTWTFYLLMRNPQVVSAIRDEIRSEGVAEALAGDPWSDDYESIRPGSLLYTMAVFYEALRLYPPVPFELKQCLVDTVLPDGTFLPKTSIILWCTWAMNRSKLIWGDDAEEFRPDRWLEDGRLVSKSASEYPVFNGGLRTCLGKKMAESMAVTVIAKMVWDFDFEDAEGVERISKNSLTLPMEGGLPVMVKPR